MIAINNDELLCGVGLPQYRRDGQVLISEVTGSNFESVGAEKTTFVK